MPVLRVAIAAVMCAAAGVGATASGAATPAQPWQDTSQPAMQRADELLAAMTTDQKIDLVQGTSPRCRAWAFPR